MVIVIHSLEDALRVGGILAKSGYFKNARSEAQALAKILASHELGFGAVVSLQNVHLVDGKLTLSASMMAALVKRSGRYNYKILESNSTNCTIEFYEKWDGKWEAIGRASFSLDEARKAGLLTKHNWAKYPIDMLFARAMSRGCRQFCPDVFTGSVYVEGEIESGETLTLNQSEEEIEINPSQLQLPQSNLEPVPNLLGKQANEIIYRLGLSTADCPQMCQQRYGADGWANLSHEQQQDFLKFLQGMFVENLQLIEQ